MSRLWPRTLAAQLILLLLLALVASQLVTFAILEDERRGAVMAIAREQVLERAAALVRLLDATASPGERQRALRASSTRQLRFWLAAEPVIESADAGLGGLAERRLARRLASLLEGGRELEIRIAAGAVARPHPPGRAGRPAWHGAWHRATEAGAEPGQPLPAPPASGLLLAIRVEPTLWLNAAMLVPPERPRLASLPLAALLAAALAISLAAALSLRRLTRPLASLAAAADAVGRGEPVTVDSRAGPLEIRRTAEAFNTMQARIGRSLVDRTRLVGAISHDLRTPITTLRLRAELVDDPALREKMLATLDEMQALTEAGLLLARDTGSEEPTRPVDLVALLESVVGDFVDQGHDAQLEPPSPDFVPLVLRCRKLALTRAIRNLVENAIRYGERARIAMARRPAGVHIRIDDDGPGLPEAMLERLFEPFVRLEESRSRETGGSGLGLAIARALIRGHGGEVTLANRPGGGLRATVLLPLERTSVPAADDN